MYKRQLLSLLFSLNNQMFKFTASYECSVSHSHHQAVTVLLSRWNIVQISRLLSSFPRPEGLKNVFVCLPCPFPSKE